MRKILSNKVYDTETANYVGGYEHDLANNLGWCVEKLYRKRTGEYFIYGEGGPMSRYSVDLGSGNYSGGEAIKPISYDEAREWAEENLDTEEYEAEFGIVEEDEEMTSIHVQIPASLNDRLEAERSKSGMSKSGIVIEALEDYLQVFVK